MPNTRLLTALLRSRGAKQACQPDAWRLTVCCEQPAMTRLRLLLAQEVQAHGLTTVGMVATPASHDKPASLCLTLGPTPDAKQRSQRLANRLSQLPAIHRVSLSQSAAH